LNKNKNQILKKDKLKAQPNTKKRESAVIKTDSGMINYNM
jgi:hypothetical protein